MINTKSWLTAETWEHGARIDYTRLSDTNIDSRKNVIQISTTEHLILYDLDKEQEVSNLLNYNRFASDANYVDSGFTVYSFNKNDRL
jgi:hypothetical protein